MPKLRSVVLFLAVALLLTGAVLSLVTSTAFFNETSQTEGIVAQANRIERLLKQADELDYMIAAELKHPQKERGEGAQPSRGRLARLSESLDEIQVQLADQRKEMDRLIELRYQPKSQTYLPYITAATTIIGSIGTIFTILFSWRSDRRTQWESELKNIQLQQQIADLQHTLDDYKKLDDQKIIMP